MVPVNSIKVLSSWCVRQCLLCFGYQVRSDHYSTSTKGASRDVVEWRECEFWGRAICTYDKCERGIVLLMNGLQSESLEFRYCRHLDLMLTYYDPWPLRSPPSVLAISSTYILPNACPIRIFHLSSIFIRARLKHEHEIDELARTVVLEEEKKYKKKIFNLVQKSRF